MHRVLSLLIALLLLTGGSAALAAQGDETPEADETAEATEPADDEEATEEPEEEATEEDEEATEEPEEEATEEDEDEDEDAEDEDASEDEDDAGSGAEDPAVGDGVPYLSEGGRELALITVEEVEADFEDFDEFFSPNPDSQYVAATVTFENTGGGAFNVEPYYLSLETAGGFLYQTAFVSRPEETRPPDLESVQIEEGDEVTGFVAFEVPRDADLVRIFYTPESGRLVLLADLRISDIS